MKNVDGMSLFNELVELNEVSDRRFLDVLNIDLEAKIKDLKENNGESIVVFIREKGNHKDVSKVPVNPKEFVNLYSDDYVNKIAKGLIVKVFMRRGNQFGIAFISKKTVVIKEEQLVEEKPITILSKKAK